MLCSDFLLIHHCHKLSDASQMSKKKQKQCIFIKCHYNLSGVTVLLTAASALLSLQRAKKRSFLNNIIMRQYSAQHSLWHLKGCNDIWLQDVPHWSSWKFTWRKAFHIHIWQSHIDIHCTIILRKQCEVNIVRPYIVGAMVEYKSLRHRRGISNVAPPPDTNRKHYWESWLSLALLNIGAVPNTIFLGTICQICLKSRDSSWRLGHNHTVYTAAQRRTQCRHEGIHNTHGHTHTYTHRHIHMHWRPWNTSSLMSTCWLTPLVLKLARLSFIFFLTPSFFFLSLSTN